MTSSTHDSVLGLFHKARRRIRAEAAARATAICLWPLAAATWLLWLVHRYVHPISAWQVLGIVGTWVLLTCIAVLLRLPNARQTLLRADRALDARSLLVCALDTATSGRRVSGAAATRVARDARALASGCAGSLAAALPVAWPGHGTAALFAVATAAILLSLPGASARTQVATAAPTPAPSAPATAPVPMFADSAQQLALALADGARRDEPSALSVDRRTSARFSTGAGNSPNDPVAEMDAHQDTSASAQRPAAGGDAAQPGGNAASGSAAGRPTKTGRADGAPTMDRHAIERVGSSTGPHSYRRLPLDVGTGPGERADIAGLAETSSAPDGRRYRSPAMRHYLARFEQLRQEIDR